MRRFSRCLLPAGLLAMLAFTVPAGAGHNADSHSQNMKLLASSPHPAVGTDLAFWGRLAYAGNSNGFRILDISDPEAPVTVANVTCPASQNDISVWDGLVFLSVDGPRTQPTCDGTPTTASNPSAWEGIRIFDASNPSSPEFVTAVRTDCGSHTHTLVPDLANDRVLLYVSSYGLTSGSIGPDCQADHNKISIVEVPLDDPADASVLREQPLHPDTQFLVGSDILPGLLTTRGCHDITVYQKIGLAAAACLAEGQLWDISDPANPDTLNAVRIDNPDIQVWHSSAFTWDGKVVAFGDENGGGIFPRCRSTDPSTAGAIWFYRVSDTAELGYFKIPRFEETGVCTAHLFNFLPGVRGYILASSWYTAGTSMVDATNPAAPKEIGFYDAANANTWSTYWYNDFVYANEIAGRGVDIFLFSDRARAGARRLPFMNPQTQ
jgi:hypothetical protein